MKRKGFTLVELLVAMAIIGIILGLALFGISAAQRNARDTERKAFAKDLYTALLDFEQTQQKKVDYVVYDYGKIIFWIGTFHSTYCPSGNTNCYQMDADGNLTISSGAVAGKMIDGVESRGATMQDATQYCMKRTGSGVVIKVYLESGGEFNFGDSLDNTCP